MIHYPNMAIIAGNGKNVGKTFLCCELIAHFAKFHPVVALKTSPHLHALNDTGHIIAKDRHFTLIEEQHVTSKDSSRMLQAGASKAYFLQYENITLSALLGHIQPLLPLDKPVICESGSLGEYIIPGMYFFITTGEGDSTFPSADIEKERQFIIKPGHAEHFNVKLLSFENGKLSVPSQ